MTALTRKLAARPAPTPCVLVGVLTLTKIMALSLMAASMSVVKNKFLTTGARAKWRNDHGCDECVTCCGRLSRSGRDQARSCMTSQQQDEQCTDIGSVSEFHFSICVGLM